MARARSAGIQWVLDFLLERWPQVLVGVLSITMIWLARLSKVLEPYAPVAWGAVGIVSALLLAVVFWVVSVAYRRWVLTRFEVRRAEAIAVNPLAGQFSNRRLRLADFFHPFFKPTSAAKFQDCELLGPAAVFLMGSQLMNSGFVGCEVVIVKESASVVGVTAFKNCIFERCQFFQVTFFMTKAQYLWMKQQTGVAPPVISDGTAGDLSIEVKDDKSQK